jgi:hypothetical protein
MIWRRGLKHRVPAGRARPYGRCAEAGSPRRPGCFEGGAVVVLSPVRICPGLLVARPGSAVNMASKTSRSSALAPVTAQATGRPCRVQTRCSRSPRTRVNRRRSTRTRPIRPGQNAVWCRRERPHSIGVESTTQISSIHAVLLAARPGRSAGSSPQPGAAACCIRAAAAGTGTGMPQVRVGVPHPHLSSACIIAWLTSSVSASCGRCRRQPPWRLLAEASSQVGRACLAQPH